MHTRLFAQVYVNRESVPIESSYIFPLDARAAVCDFEAETPLGVVRAELKEKEHAKSEYRDAMCQGKTAALLTQEADDVFRALVGNIAPHSRITVRVVYVAELVVDKEGGAVRFTLPTVVAPRYTPAGAAAVPSPPTATTAVVVRPGRFSWATAVFAVGAPYTLDVRVRASMSSRITRVDALSYASAVQLARIDGTTAEIVVPAIGALNADLVLNIFTEKPPVAQVFVEHHPERDTHAVMLAITPDIRFAERKCEFVFVVDRSGSMSGGQIAQAGRALELFVRSLPVDSFFNVVSFGSNHTLLFPASAPNSPESARQGLALAGSLAADMGGTEILAPLVMVLGARSIPGYDRQVFVLTDGEVSNVDEVIAAVGQANKGTRVFSMGIGENVSHALVDGIARAGRGTAKYVFSTAGSTEMQEAVIGQLDTALQPSIENVSVTWSGVPLGEFQMPAAAVAAAAAPESAEVPSPGAVKTLFGYRSADASPSRAQGSTALRAANAAATAALDDYLNVLAKQAPFHAPPIFSGERFLV